MKNLLTRSGLVIAVCVILLIASAPPAWAQAGTRIEISFPSTVHADPITGRVFVIIGKISTREPRLQVGFWGGQAPFFGADVDQLKSDQAAVIDAGTLGYPADSLKDVPAGDYHVQALLNIYTKFTRADGHVIWAHNDQWEGQQFNRSPGNLFSEVQKVHLDPAAGYNLKLNLTGVIPPMGVPPDTEWVKRVKFESRLLSKFWGQPMYLGATILLPKGYDSHPDARYPVVYYQDHFGIGAPLGLRAETATPGQETSSSSFYQRWVSEDYPRLIIISFQHPTPYFDDSYAVNSANNGPYGDAIMTELIPYLEEHFRIIRKPYARLLTGGSTGGWESLALQVFHPDFFGATWTWPFTCGTTAMICATTLKASGGRSVQSWWGNCSSIAVTWTTSTSTLPFTCSRISSRRPKIPPMMDISNGGDP